MADHKQEIEFALTQARQATSLDFLDDIPLQGADRKRDLDRKGEIEFQSSIKPETLKIVKVDAKLLSLKTVPEGTNCLEYTLYEQAFMFPSVLKNREQLLENDINILNDILKKNPGINKVIIKELGSFGARVFESDIPGNWYDCLVSLIRGSSVRSFSFMNLIHKYFDLLDCYGPNDLLEFSKLLYQNGIRELDLGSSDFSTFMPSSLRSAYYGRRATCPETCSCNFPVCISWICCCPILCGMLICGNPNQICLEFDEIPDAQELRNQDRNYFQEVYRTLCQFSKVKFSNNMFETWAKRYKVSDSSLNLEHFIYALKGSKLRALNISNFNFKYAHHESIIEFFKTVFENNNLEEFTLTTSRILSLPREALTRIAQYIAKSKIRHLDLNILDILDPNNPVLNNDILDKLEVFVNILKTNTSMIYCLLFRGRVIFDFVGDDHKKRRYISIFNDLQKCMMRNLINLDNGHLDSLSMQEIPEWISDNFALKCNISYNIFCRNSLNPSQDSIEMQNEIEKSQLITKAMNAKMERVYKAVLMSSLDEAMPPCDRAIKSIIFQYIPTEDIHHAQFLSQATRELEPRI